MAKTKEKKGVLYPLGFMAASINCGIKESKNDLTLLVCPTGATVAGTFTKNLCCAAPVEQFIILPFPVCGVKDRGKAYRRVFDFSCNYWKSMLIY
ncbi:bifunctional ornithine acetyltransferase/N-acetylglutamate synthase [bacterium]|nr:bifunctional ornithine acetyltransferase/N-acetylglutamate synthase [bacterium]